MATRDHARRPGWPQRLLLPVSLVTVAVLAVTLAWHAAEEQEAAQAAAYAASLPPRHVGAPRPEPTRTPSTTVSPRPSSSPSRSAAPVTSSPSAKANGSPGPSASPTSSGTPKPSASPTRTARSYLVVVLNATTREGWARETADSLQEAGWRIEDIGNWSERPPATTVYYPSQAKAAAAELASDLGADRVREAYDALPEGRLVVVLG